MMHVILHETFKFLSAAGVNCPALGKTLISGGTAQRGMEE